MNTGRRGWLAVLVLGCALLQGCATTTGANADPRDPWEGMNRKVYAFNDAVDVAIVKPVAQAYVRVLPSFVRTGVRNFVGNLVDVWSAANAALQLKGQAAVEGFMRVAVNSTLGLYGVLDIASEAGLDRPREDFGQTLGHWGVGPGPYVVLPLLGPSTLRDSLAFPVDWMANPARFFSGSDAQTAVTVLRITDQRANLLTAGDAFKAAALDPYSFLREGWLQKRENEVYDGNPPQRFDYRDPDSP
ncbi:MAG: VacJ family lipoprotein [Limnohabitans sp.]